LVGVLAVVQVESCDALDSRSTALVVVTLCWSRNVDGPPEIEQAVAFVVMKGKRIADTSARIVNVRAAESLKDAPTTRSMMTSDEGARYFWP
jgi:hypothetical protein